ncbi:MAG: sodium-dependent transporter [Bacteroidia bacterium]|nr:sodium-dependent transporter [Bacteroidia bacterium]
MEHWGSRLGALVALIGGAVGLGNFLRFPFQAAKWGGGAFLIPYFVALISVGLPLVWMEMALGRAGVHSKGRSAPELLQSLLGRRGWYIGLLGVYGSIAIGSYYAYLTGWTLGYACHAVLGSFSALSLTEVAGFHRRFLEREAVIFWFITWVLTGLILKRGLRRGLEWLNLWGMPMLFVLGIGIAVGAVFLGSTERCPTCDASLGIAYLYTPRWQELYRPAVWLAAAGQVFFSIGVGFAMYPVYAASARRLDPLREGTQTVLANTLAEVGLGGLIVIPITTAFLGLEYVQREAGFGMGFTVMPYVLREWGGRVLIAGWYVLLFLAALSSLLAMGWVALTWLSGSLGGEPSRWTWLMVGGMAILGVPVVLGYQRGTLELYDQVAGTLGLTVAALGHWWAFHKAHAWKAVEAETSYALGKGQWFLLRWVAPIFLITLLIANVLQPQDGDWAASVEVLFREGRWLWSDEALPLQVWRALSQSSWSLVGAVMLGLLAVVLVALRRRA